MVLEQRACEKQREAVGDDARLQSLQSPNRVGQGIPHLADPAVTTPEVSPFQIF